MMTHVRQILALAMGFGGFAVLVQPAPHAAAQVAEVRTVPPASQLYGFQTRDPLADAFFTPDVIMRNQEEIGLTAQQRTAIVNAISEAQPRFIEAQWQLQPETAALAALVQGERVDEAAVLAQVDVVLEIERQIKRIQVELLVRIKNQLTLQQQEQLARSSMTLQRALERGIGVGGGLEVSSVWHPLER